MSDGVRETDEAALLRAFADPARLRLLGSLAARPHSAAELAEGARLAPSAVSRHLAVLAEAGLVAPASDGMGGFELRIDRLNEIARRLAERGRDLEREAAERAFPDLAPDDARVVRSFVRDGRLSSMPAQESKKVVVLRYLLERCFPEDRAYPEREVNERLAAWNEDVAALRRYLVDYGLMTRAGGEYRRA